MGDLNMSFGPAHGRDNKDNRNNRNNRNNNNNFELDNGERGASPLNLPSSPIIPIPERKYTEEEEAVINKFIDFVRIQNVNDKPYLIKQEKDLMRQIFWSRQLMYRIQRRLDVMGIHKEEANLENNYKKILSRTPGFTRSRSKSRGRNRRRNRKTRKL
jgi:hypothetical protein